MKRLAVWSFALALLGVPLALLLIALLCVEDQPTIARPVELTPEQTGRAKRILQAHDPRKLPPGVLRTFSIAGEDLDVATNFLLAQYGGAAKVSLQPGAIMLWASLRLPANPLGSYVNIETMARQTAGLPAFDRIRIGRLPLPPALADWLLAHALDRLNATESGQVAADVIEGVRVDGGYLQVAYRWRDDLPQRLRKALLPAADQARLRAHQERLAELMAAADLPRQISVIGILQPMLRHAAARSVNGDAVAENRAAIIVLAFYVNGHGLGAIVPDANNWPRAMPRKVTLSGRVDFPQHFLVSAAVAATAGTPLADAVGIYKEVEDARAGSGFSFTDIAADRAGTVFGEQATRSLDSARSLQRRLTAAAVEADFMPPAADLPEGLSAADFKRRFGGVGEPAYQRMMAEIERRLARLTLYR